MFFFFFQAEDGIRDAQESRGLGDVYKRQVIGGAMDGTDKSRSLGMKNIVQQMQRAGVDRIISVGGLGILDDLTKVNGELMICLLYTSDAADDLLCVDLGGRRIIKKKQKKLLMLIYIETTYSQQTLIYNSIT